jgi:tRNA dimethylallyltransferase
MSSIADSDGSSVRIICGPTAAGKSAVALRLAERHGAVIISADSRQIYRGFDIGTAKPSAEERRRVPHLGLDVVDPSERYSAALFAQHAHEWIREAHQAGREPVIVGGTGFYLKALVEPLFESPTLDAIRRAALERAFAEIETERLRRWCQVLDPERAHLGRTQLIRSAETAFLTGRRLSDLHTERARTPLIRASYLVVDPGARLAAQIEGRFGAMMAAGWADEVNALTQSVDQSAPAWNASGYGAIRELVRGTISPEQARERVIIETRQYAKRQRTWFRHQLESAVTTRVDPHDPAINAAVNDWWEGKILA